MAETVEPKANLSVAFGAGYKVEPSEDFVANFKSLENSILLVFIAKKYLEF